MNFSDEKVSVLQNMEFSVAQVWRSHPEMSDYVALRAYEAALQVYRAELRGHTPKPPQLSGLDAETFEAVNAMCEFRLGRRPSPDPKAKSITPSSVELIVDCLRELMRSVERHTKIDGRQGYLTFIDQFVP